MCPSTGDRAAPDPSEIRAELERIVSSHGFWHAEALTRFLRYIVEETLAGRAEAIKEYSLGLAVFDRGASFDPKANTIVRVQARRLRAKLADYYVKNGHTGAVVIELHKGSYIPVFASQRKPPKDTQALPSLSPPRTPIQRFLGRRFVALRMFAFAVLATGVALTVWVGRPAKHELSYTQITNFTDSAMAPVLSRDGRMVAFFRSDIWLVTPDQIYIKMLPNGEPVQVTHDPRRKCCVAFSPDGSRIAYTVYEPGPWKWKTFTVPSLGGESSLLLSNAAGLTWLDERRLLFSEISTGWHMGIVVATENRSEYRKVYFPQHERAMAHFSYPSPDRKWVLVIEMNPAPDWSPCRVVPLDGTSLGRQVGPQGKCTAAAWSPDGKWMYFGAEVDGKHHLWRQRFPRGEPEMLTSGPTEEDGLAIAPDGRSLITSIGTHQTAVWIHGSGGARPISSEGYVTSNVAWSSSITFSPDAKSLLYLLRHEPDEAATELWRTDLESGRSERALSGFSIWDYDISSDGKNVLFSTQPSSKASQLWLAPLDRRSRPKLIASTGEASPHFGPDDQVFFRVKEGTTNHLIRMEKDGSGRSRVVPYPIGTIMSISPDRRWIAVISPLEDGSGVATMAVPSAGGSPRRICVDACPAAWAPDGKFLYVGVVAASDASPGKTLAIPVPLGETLPRLPASGIRSLGDAAALPGAQVVDGWEISPGPIPSVFAYVKTTVHRNLFRILLY